MRWPWPSTPAWTALGRILERALDRAVDVATRAIHRIPNHAAARELAWACALLLVGVGLTWGLFGERTSPASAPQASPVPASSTAGSPSVGVAVRPALQTGNEPVPAPRFPVARSPARRPGGLVVKTAPWSTVSLDGRYFDDAPWLIAKAVPAGNHRIGMERDGRTFQESIMIYPGKVTVVTCLFATGRVDVRVDPWERYR